LRWYGLFAVAGAVAGVSVCGPATAQSLQEALGGPLVGGTAARNAPPAAAVTPGYLGVTFEMRGNDRIVAAIDPAGPAAGTDLQVGDKLLTLRASPYSPFQADTPFDVAGLEGWIYQHKAGSKVSLWYSRPGVRSRQLQLTLAAASGVAMPAGAGAAASGGATRKAMSASDVEQARTAYFQMCGKGSERLSRETCDGMRRDLDAAVAAQAAARREAEVMGVYRQLCTPSAPKLSPDTCASMLAEAKRTLAAPAPAAQPQADDEAGSDKASGTASGPAGPAPAKRAAPRRKKK